MPRTVETVVHEIGELSEAAREHARAWYRETCLDHEWHDAVFEDFEAICGILGVTLQTTPCASWVGTRDKPHLSFADFGRKATEPASRAN